MNKPATTMTTRLILHCTPPAETTQQTTPARAVFQTYTDPSRKTILDKQRKLLISKGEDGQKRTSHVENFVGLYPAWPIIEVAISPTGNAKEERMNIYPR